MTDLDLERELFDEYGPFAPISAVWRRLSFSSLDAARKAAARGTMPIEPLTLPHRRGRYVRTVDLAQWIRCSMSRT